MFMLSGIRLQADWENAPNIRGGERRREERYAEEIDLAFEVDHNSHFYAGLSQDISQGGLFVATYHIVPVGTPLRICLDLPDGDKLEARGEVRWVQEAVFGDARPGIGVAFTELSPAARERITRICEERPPLYVDF
jgi:uncharacterized protein (TIGR02266 family)